MVGSVGPAQAGGIAQAGDELTDEVTASTDGAAASTSGAAASTSGATASTGASAPSQVLVVRLASAGPAGQDPDRAATLEALEQEAAALDLTWRHAIEGLDAVVFGVPGDVDEAASRLADVDGVLDVERDTGVRAHQRVPNDARWADQWGLPQIHAPEAWETTIGDPETTIAVLDTGVEADHADLLANVTGDVVDNLVAPLSGDTTDDGANFTDDGAPTDTSDRHGHGTASAGVAAADSDNTDGIAGGCWRCRFLPVKVLGDDGSGMASDVAAGIDYAANHGADVISLSLGAANSTNLLADAVSSAAQQGVLVVASAGNFGTQERVYPAAYEDAVGVVASDRDDERYDFSSFGDWAEIAAPGCNPATDLGGGYKRFCGTSSAAPVVAGVAGLARSAQPDASVAQLRQALREGAASFHEARWGRLDAAATLAALPHTEDPGVDDDLDDSDPEGELDGRTDLDDPREEQDGDPGVAQRRLSGVDRFATAARLSRNAFPEEDQADSLLGGVVDGTGPDQVYLTSGLTFADALAAGPAAGIAQAPVLLAARDTLPAATADELARLEPEEVVVVGGPSAIGERVAERVAEAADAPVRRLAGGDRFATAAEVALDAFDAGVDTAYVATGVGFADALAGVPAAVADRAPMLLTGPDQLPAPIAEALTELAPDRVLVLGGPSAVSPAVAGQLDELVDGSVGRLAGDGRFATAAAAAARFDAAETAHIATGANFPDALAAGPIAGLDGAPLLLATRDQLPAVTRDQLERLRPDTNVVLGGTAVLSDRVQTDAAWASADS